MPSESNPETLLDRHLKRLGAVSTSSSPPSTSLSSIFPIHASSDNKVQQAEHHRLDTSVEGPPGLEGITIRINGIGVDPMFIIGRIVDNEALLKTMPMSIASSPVEKIDAAEESQVEVEKTSVKDEDDEKSGSEEIDYSEMIDLREIGSDPDQPIDPEDLVFDISTVDDTGIFPISVPRDSIRRSNSRRRKLKKKFALQSDGCTRSDCQDCPTPEF